MICEPEEALEQIYPLKLTQFVYFPGRNFPVRKKESDFKYNSKLKNMQKRQEFSAFEHILEK